MILVFMIKNTSIFYNIWEIQKIMKKKSIALIIIFATTIISFIKTVFIGKKYIKIEDGKLLIKRREDIILSVNKNEIEKLVVIFDIFFEDIDFIKFQYNGKKYFFEIPIETNDELKVYINDLNYKRKRTILLRVVLTILGVYYWWYLKIINFIILLFYFKTGDYWCPDYSKITWNYTK